MVRFVLNMVRFVLKRGPFCPERGPFCPDRGPFCPWSVLSMVRHVPNSKKRPGPEVIKLFSCSAQMSMNFFLLVNVKMPTIVSSLTFMSENKFFPAHKC